MLQAADYLLTLYSDSAGGRGNCAAVCRPAADSVQSLCRRQGLIIVLQAADKLLDSVQRLCGDKYDQNILTTGSRCEVWIIGTLLPIMQHVRVRHLASFVAAVLMIYCDDL